MRTPSRPVLPAAGIAAAVLLALGGCTAPEPEDAPAAAPAARPTPGGTDGPAGSAPRLLPASDPVEIGVGDVVPIASARPEGGRLTFTDLGPGGTDIRLTGLEQITGDIRLVLLDEFQPKPGCLPDVFHMSSWQPDLVPDGQGAHVAHVDRHGDRMGNPAEFPHAMMMDAGPWGSDPSRPPAPAGCIFPTVAEAEITWRAR
ncbi:hypothetical protein [Clavibacter zhangzhiyongii]|uniref:hypothetical protein n=1 Tax=Clavibacter zhangzhiyongii TaxID=2768071 RepID=UPI0039E1426F